MFLLHVLRKSNQDKHTVERSPLRKYITLKKDFKVEWPTVFHHSKIIIAVKYINLSI